MIHERGQFHPPQENTTLPTIRRLVFGEKGYLIGIFKPFDFKREYGYTPKFARRTYDILRARISKNKKLLPDELRDDTSRESVAKVLNAFIYRPHMYQEGPPMIVDGAKIPTSTELMVVIHTFNTHVLAQEIDLPEEQYTERFIEFIPKIASTLKSMAQNSMISEQKDWLFRDFMYLTINIDPLLKP